LLITRNYASCRQPGNPQKRVIFKLLMPRSGRDGAGRRLSWVEFDEFIDPQHTHGLANISRLSVLPVSQSRRARASEALVAPRLIDKKMAARRSCRARCDYKSMLASASVVRSALSLRLTASRAL
jgi:hypothetical protein